MISAKKYLKFISMKIKNSISEIEKQISQFFKICDKCIFQ